METNNRANTRGYDIFKALVSLGLLGAIAIILLQGRQGTPIAAVPGTVTPAAATPAEATPAPATGVALATPALNPPEAFADGTVALSGTGTPGAVLAVLANGQRLDAVEVSPDGTWSYEAQLEPGDYTVSVQTLDADGNVVNETAGVAASVPAPVAAPELQTPQVGTEGQLSLQGTAEPGATVEVVAGGVSLGTAVAAADGTWSFTAQLDPGSYDLVVRTLDAEGNVVGESATVTVEVPAAEVATATPVPPEAAAAGATVELPEGAVAGAVTLAGTGQPGSRVEVLVDGVSAGQATVGASRRWTLNVDVPEPGEHEIVLQTRDASGALVVQSLPVALRLLAEAAAEAVPAIQAAVEQQVLTLRGAGEPGAEVEVVADDEVVGTATVADDGSWTFSGEIPAGAEQLVARFRDAAGQVISETEPVAVAEAIAAALPALEARVREGVLTMRGAGEPGAEVEVVADDEVVGTATVADDGSWTFSGEIPAGAEQLVARFRDAAGQVISETEPVAVAEAIAAALPALEARIREGVLTMRGAGEPGAEVEVVADDEVVGTATVADDGSWTFSGEIPAGAEQLVARFRDAAGQVISETEPVAVAEAIAAALPALEARIREGVLTMRGAGEPGAEVEVVADDEVVGTATVADDGSWTFTGEIPAGAQQLVARFRNATGQVVGETGPVKVADVLAAASAAAAEAVPAIQAEVEQRVLRLRGTGEPGAEVEVVADDEVVGAATVADDGSWTFTGEIPAGAEQLVARFRDAAGRVLSETEPVKVTDALSAVAAAVAKALPAFQAAVREGVLTLRGTGEPGAEVEVVADDEVVGTATVADDGTWTFTGEIPAGAEALVARLRNAAGQVVGETEPVKVADVLATVAAAVAKALPAFQAAVREGVLTLRGTGEPGAEVEVVADDEVVGTATVADDGTWTFTGEIPARAEALVARLQDAAGQVVGETEPVKVADVLATAAAAAVPAFQAEASNGALTLRGTGEPGAEVEVVADDEVVGTATVAADGTWTFTGQIPVRARELVARFRDAAGQVLSEAEPVKIAEALATAAATLPPFEAEASNGALTLRGTGEPGAEVEIVADDEVVGTTTVAADGTWTFSGEIAAEAEALVARFRDAAGKVVGETELVSAADALAAAAAALPAFQATVKEGVLTLRGTGEPGAEIEIAADDEVVGTTTVADDGTWTFTGEIAAGAQQLVTRFRDAAGRVIRESKPIAVPVLQPRATVAAAPPVTRGCDGTAARTCVTPSAGAPQGQTYVVRTGDSLTGIAERFYRNVRAYPRIVAATNLKAAEDPTFQTISDPDLIYIGQKLWLPVLSWNP